MLSRLKFKRTSELLAIGILVVISYPVPRVNAIAAGLGVRNAIQDIEVPAGSKIDNRVTVFNNSTSTPLPVHVDLLLWNLQEDADDIEFVRAEESLNATLWFDVEATDFILEPEGSRTVKFTISPPAETPPGSYFVMIRFTPQFPEFYFEEQGPRFLPEIGTLVFLKVPLFGLGLDDSLYAANIESIEPGGVKEIPLAEHILPKAQAGVFDNGVRKILTRVQNNGVFHFKASGNIEVKNIFGRVVAKSELPGRYLMPNRTRSVDVELIKPDVDPNASLLARNSKAVLQFLRVNSYFGPYSATMTLFVPNSQPIVETINFWVIPWKFLGILATLIIGSILISRKFGRRLKYAYKVLFKFKKSTLQPE